MKPKICLMLLANLLRQPSFTSKEAREVGVPAAVLGYYVKSGALKRLNRGVYQAANYQNVESFRWADLIEAVYSINDGVVCLISALAVYELTEEIPRQHWIGIPHKRSARTKRQIKIIRFRNIDLGRTKIELEGSHIPIFDQERTIIDSFRLLSREVAIKALKLAVGKRGKHCLDFIKLEAYAKKLKFDITPYLLIITT